jgi:3-oxoisoapionate decarboxylase
MVAWTGVHHRRWSEDVKVGVGSWTYPWEVGVPGRTFPDQGPSLTSQALLDRAVGMGAGVVQLADNIHWEELAPAQLVSLGDAARRSGVILELGTRGIEPDRLRRLIGRCGDAGVTLLRTVVDRSGHEPSPDEVVDAVRTIVPDLRTHGVRLAIENHDRLGAARFVDIVQRLGVPEVGICLDTVNSLGAGEGPEVVIGTLAPYALCLHVKDVRIRRADHGLGFLVEGTPVGDGQLDVPALLRAVRGNGHDPNAIIELWMPPMPTWAETVAREQAWADQSFGVLRALVAAADGVG